MRRCLALGVLALGFLASPGLAVARPWRLQDVPAPDTYSSLSDVACGSPTSCAAVGTSGGARGGATLAEQWDGTSWTIEPTADPSPGNTSPKELAGVSCPGTNMCIAVGSYGVPAGFDTLAEEWDGSSWTLQTTPNPTPPGPTFANELLGVSCPSTQACVAVGSDSSGVLVMGWNAGTWPIQSAPSRGEGDSLSGVSCSSATSCIAVGSYMRTTDGTIVAHALAERWNGSSWTLMQTPNPPGSHGTYLRRVSCSSRTVCTAVGHYYANARRQSRELAERWNGRRWQIQKVPTPSGARVSAISAVTCSSATDCTAVGSYRHMVPAGYRKYSTIAVRWNGYHWALQHAATPAGLFNSRLLAVACPLPGKCTAVGYKVHYNRDSPLAESHS